MHVQEAHDILAFVINSLGSHWQPKQMTIGLFKTIKTISQALAKNLTKLFDQYGLSKKKIAYVKDEGSNSNAMTKLWNQSWNVKF